MGKAQSAEKAAKIEQVFKVVVEHGPQTLLDISRRTGFNPASLPAYLCVLVHDGRLDRCDRPPARGGRGVATYRIATDAEHQPVQVIIRRDWAVEALFGKAA